MKLWESLKLADSLKAKAQIVWEHYESHKSKSFEPEWIHSQYAKVRDFGQGLILKPEDQTLVVEVVASHSLEDGCSVQAIPGMPNTALRIIHDGWKAGSATWVFMGRAENSIQHGDWVFVNRTLPAEFYALLDQSEAPPELWVAYHLKEEKIVGPAIYYSDLVATISKFT